MMNSLLDLSDISIAEVGELTPESSYDFTSNFSDGQSDGENNFEPIVYQWFNADYRRGYIVGVAKRIGMEHALIYGAEIDKVIIV